MHAVNDNISVYYQRVDDSTPLGPVAAGNGTVQGPATRKTAEDADGTIASDGKYYPYCTNGSNTGGGFGWQPELGGPNDGSCFVRVVTQQPAPTPAPASPAPSQVSGSSNLSVSIEVTSTWDSGYCANIKLQNTGNSPTKSWTLALNKNGANMTQTWNLSSTGNSGDTVTYKPVAEWNAVIPAGGSANQQGFCVSRSSTSAEVKVTSVSAD
jgi:cellulase/cellobiase CelA1